MYFIRLNTLNDDISIMQDARDDDDDDTYFLSAESS